MKKEKWLLKEIESWQTSEIVNEETANKLKSMYQPKKSIGLLIVLFSIIGSHPTKADMFFIVNSPFFTLFNEKLICDAVINI